MKIKNLILVVLMVLILGLVPVFSTEYFLNLTIDSRYVVDGIDYTPDNDMPMAMFSLAFSEKDFGGFFYVVSSKNYSEWGASLDYIINLGEIELKSIFFPFGWQAYGDTDWGFMLMEEVNTDSGFMAKYACAYVPDMKDLNGHYFYVGFTREFLGFNWSAGLNYNWGLFTEGEGLGAIFSVLKTIELKENVFLDIYTKCYVNHETVNENEVVVGTTLTIKL